MTNSHAPIRPGDPFPNTELDTLDHGTITLGGPHPDGRWDLVIVYRGIHCPMCRAYLTRLAPHADRIRDLGADLVIMTADAAPAARTVATNAGFGADTVVAHGLTIDQMRQLALRISDTDVNGIDHPHPEPGTYMIAPDGIIHALDISSVSFLRPEIEWVLQGLQFMTTNHHPIPGSAS